MSSAETGPHLLPDSVARHPALRFAPAWAVPYVQLARIDRPIGWWLLLLPCWESSALASAVEGRGQLDLEFLREKTALVHDEVRSPLAHAHRQR